jgi:putative transposase
MAPTRRRLPHIYPIDTPLFLTWHLHGSIPAALIPPPGPLSSGEAFVWLDRRLDSTRKGPMYLRQPEIAQVVVDSIYKGVELDHYKLYAYVIMANHVHLLIEPSIAPYRLLRSLKGSTAREANRLLGRTGESFWQKESYDHWVRNSTEFLKIKAYIENNPVKAGFVRNARDYSWSSAGVEMSLDAARTSACATRSTLPLPS